MLLIALLLSFQNALASVSIVEVSCSEFYSSFLVQRVDYNWTLLKYDNCPMKLPIVLTLNLSSTNINVINILGNVVVSNNISGDFELNIEANKCDLDFSNCQKYVNANIKEMCAKFEEEGKFFSTIFPMMEPAFLCPINAGFYSLDKTFVDMGSLRVLNLDGFVWVVKFKLIAVNPDTKLKKVALCVNSEIKITKVVRRSTKL
jgi:hypothetical protein